MHCASCVGKVESSLAKVPGVSSAAVNLATEQATVDYEAGACTLDQLYAAIEAAGYEPKPLARTYAVRGMHCASCVKKVEDALLGVDGVERAQVNFATEHATVTAPPTVGVDALRRAVAAAGYELTREVEAGAEVEDEEAQERARAERDLRIRMVFALGVGAVLMVLAQAGDIPGLSDVRRPLHQRDLVPAGDAGAVLGGVAVLSRARGRSGSIARPT